MNARRDGRLDMTGMWEGTYAYPAYQGPTTPFVARIVEEGGALTGSILEPNTIGFGSDELQAMLSGMRDGQAVDFVKTYDGASDAAHPVDYVGRLSDDGDLVTGVWSLAELDGTFEMRRERGWEEVVAAEQEAPLEVEPVVPMASVKACIDQGQNRSSRAKSRGVCLGSGAWA